jgi:hypothetical protein
VQPETVPDQLVTIRCEDVLAAPIQSIVLAVSFLVRPLVGESGTRCCQNGKNQSKPEHHDLPPTAAATQAAGPGR